MRRRGDSEELIRARLALAESEEAEGRELADHIIVNDDHETLMLSSNFGGVGPKLGFELGSPICSCIRFYTKANASVLLGNRIEFALARYF